jgi:hypothetical protein
MMKKAFKVEIKIIGASGSVVETMQKATLCPVFIDKFCTRFYLFFKTLAPFMGVKS